MESKNPLVSNLFRALTAVEIVVLFVFGGGLFFLPGLLEPLWPWQLTPFNTRFLGAIYLGSLVATIAVVRWPRWSPARIVVAAVSLFSGVVLLVSAIERARFLPIFSTGIWFLVYLMIFTNAFYHLWLYRQLPPADPTPPASPLNGYLLVQGVCLGLYSFGLLIAPETFSSFWPWRLDDFHGRMYSVEFFAPAIASLMLWRAAAREELLVLGWTQILGSLFAVAGLVIVDAAQHRVDWSQPGTWLWIGIFAALFGTGIWMVRRTQAVEQVARDRLEYTLRS